MKRTKLTAAGLRMILIASLVVLLAAGTAGFIVIRGMLVKKATEVSDILSRVTTSDSKLQTLKDADKALSSYAAIEKKVNEMIPIKADYEYQDIITLNIIALAKKAGVNIKNIDFSSATTGGTTSTTGTSTSSGLSLPGGISSTTANVTFESPLRYDQWLAFLHYIEVNTLRMEIGSINISSTGTSQDGHALIDSSGFTIGVYIRNA